MTTNTETGRVTGTQDKDYNLIWFTEACLSNALRLDQYIATPSVKVTTTLRSSSGRPRPTAARARSRARTC